MSQRDSFDNQLAYYLISRNEAKTDKFDVETALLYCSKFISDLPRQC